MAELVNEFAWSVSRSRTFRACKRRYYYDVYGMWNGWKPDAPERTKTLYVLSKLKTRWMWAGEIVHDAIKRFLLSIRRKETFDFAAWRKETLARMRGDFASSRNKTYWQPGKAKTCALFEHEHEIELSDEKWQESAGVVQDCLVGFEESKAYALINKTVPKDWLSLEELIRFDTGGVKVLGRMDFAYRTRERHVRVVDWKTGKDEGEDIELQMGTYALAATRLWNAEPENIETFAINLRTRHEESFPLTLETLEKTNERIRSDVKTMRALLSDPASNTAEEDRFPGVTDPDTCRWCNYQRLCPIRIAG